jgi:hypothetical protein
MNQTNKDNPIFQEQKKDIYRNIVNNRSPLIASEEFAGRSKYCSHSKIRTGIEKWDEFWDIVEAPSLQGCCCKLDIPLEGISGLANKYCKDATQTEIKVGGASPDDADQIASTQGILSQDHTSRSDSIPNDAIPNDSNLEDAIQDNDSQDKILLDASKQTITLNRQVHFNSSEPLALHIRVATRKQIDINLEFILEENTNIAIYLVSEIIDKGAITLNIASWHKNNSELDFVGRFVLMDQSQLDIRTAGNLYPKKNYPTEDHSKDNISHQNTCRTGVNNLKSSNDLPSNAKNKSRKSIKYAKSSFDSKVLQADPGVKVHARPEMNICSRKVEAIHGFSLGEIPADKLIYLMNRGFTYKQAKWLYARGFLKAIV